MSIFIQKAFWFKDLWLDSKTFDLRYALRVRKHPGDLWGIRLRNQNNTAQLGLGLVRLRSEDMAHLGLATLELAGAGLFEALGRA